jgi:hypothetical protein
MNKNAQLLCLWSAPLMGVLVTVGWWLCAHFVPPPSPALGAEEIAGLFRENTTGIRVGMILMMFGACCWGPFIAVISAQMSRIEGNPPVLAYTQLICGVLNVAIILLSSMFWTVAAFRPDRDPQLILLLNDMAWLIVAMPFGPIVIQSAAIGLAILSDKSSSPVFPRWLAYMNFWLGFLSMPAGLMTFFKTGPFAWNGLLAFWLPLVVFGVWFNTMIMMVYKAIKQQPEVGAAR